MSLIVSKFNSDIVKQESLLYGVPGFIANLSSKTGEFQLSVSVIIIVELFMVGESNKKTRQNRNTELDVKPVLLKKK